MNTEDYKSPEIGQEISCVMNGIDDELLNNADEIEKVILDSLREDKFGILNINKHYFQPQGFTMLILLSESHVAVHTYPEHNSIYFNFYSCRGPKDAEKTFENLKKKLNPQKILFVKNNEIPVLSPNH